MNILPRKSFLFFLGAFVPSVAFLNVSQADISILPKEIIQLVLSRIESKELLEKRKVSHIWRKQIDDLIVEHPEVLDLPELAIVDRFFQSRPDWNKRLEFALPLVLDRANFDQLMEIREKKPEWKIAIDQFLFGKFRIKAGRILWPKETHQGKPEGISYVVAKKIAFGVTTFDQLKTALQNKEKIQKFIYANLLGYLDLIPVDFNPVDSLHEDALAGDEHSIINFLICMTGLYSVFDTGGTAKVPFPHDIDARQEELFSRLKINDPVELEAISIGAKTKFDMAVHYFIRHGSFSAAHFKVYQAFNFKYATEETPKADPKIESTVSYIPTVKVYFLNSHKDYLE